jgi:hypothetical protein
MGYKWFIPASIIVNTPFFCQFLARIPKIDGEYITTIDITIVASFASKCMFIPPSLNLKKYMYLLVNYRTVALESHHVYYLHSWVIYTTAMGVYWRVMINYPTIP